MNFLFSINHGYMTHFKVMLRSLCEYNPMQKRLFIMTSNLTEEDKQELQQEFGSSCQINYLELSEQYFRGFPKVKRYPYTIYFRILAPLMLPQDVERVIYLDADLIVHGDLTEFYNTDFEGNAFYACTQIRGFMTWFNRVRLGVKKGYIYMNTGVMLMNIAYLRTAIDKEAIKKFTLKNKWKLTLYDQDILCKFFGNKIKLADRNKYNLADRHISFQNFLKPKKKRINLEWVEKNNVIIHYLGMNKPWKKRYRGILQGYYLKYVR